jgi:hypothetical protein
MSIQIQSIEIEGLFGKYDFHQEFNLYDSSHAKAGINLCYGRNGGGKTLLLHILANLLAADWVRLAWMSDSGITFEALRLRVKTETGAAALVVDKQVVANKSMDKTKLSTPVGVRYSGDGSFPHQAVCYFPWYRQKIQDGVIEEARHRADYEPDFVPSREWLRYMADTQATAAYGEFIPQATFPILSDRELTQGKPEYYLTSGQRQIITLLESPAQIQDAAFLIIDHPELFLHIDVQTEFIDRLLALVPGRGHTLRQIFLATHSPEICCSVEDEQAFLVDFIKF